MPLPFHPTQVAVIKVGMDIGGSDWGTDLTKGPDHILTNGGMEKMLRQRFGKRVRIYNVDCTPSKVQRPGQEVPYLDDVLRISKEVEALSKKFFNEGAFVIVLGGEQTADVGLVAGAAASDIGGGQTRHVSVTSFDGHLDCHTQITSRTKNIHGQTLASHAGYGQKDLVNFHGTGRPRVLPEDILILGPNTHNIEFFLGEYVDMTDPKALAESKIVYEAELRNAHDWGIGMIPSHAFIAEQGAVSRKNPQWRRAMNDKTYDILCRSNGHIVLCDLDHLHESDAPGVAMRNPQGISLKQSLQLAGDLGDMTTSMGQLMGVAVVECDPQKDIDNKTAKAATKFVEELMRKME